MRTARFQRHWLSHAVGISATALLHLLLLQSMTLGSLASKRAPPDDIGPGSSSIVSADGSWMSLVIVHLPGPNEFSVVEDLSSRGEALSNPTIEIVSPDPTPSAEMPELSQIDESGQAIVTAGDPAMQSMLFGRYTGQIDARIQRARRKPRSPVSEALADSGSAHASDLFRCQARISQDNIGNVTEIELMSCNGTPEWQLSLVRAIQRASPLPAPPSPTVFTNALTLSFEGKSYAPGMREDEYEASQVTSARNR